MCSAPMVMVDGDTIGYSVVVFVLRSILFFFFHMMFRQLSKASLIVHHTNLRYKCHRSIFSYHIHIHKYTVCYPYLCFFVFYSFRLHDFIDTVFVNIFLVCRRFYPIVRNENKVKFLFGLQRTLGTMKKKKVLNTKYNSADINYYCSFPFFYFLLDCQRRQTTNR